MIHHYTQYQRFSNRSDCKKDNSGDSCDTYADASGFSRETCEDYGDVVFNKTRAVSG
ncbi:hypothetical protein NEOLEDRAFT_1132127 [Neolentinus lepideus HHB14362 ss-1]|uniref:Uncharacterized protein n=1 Tax=Neolentinus lepideus HHB14362 ss-1 TaxID=1314782 RepID=A0A165TFJ6_9AGAM|nr:hypothetical protein NEOLEDRAFT_1132127 [Neolentinus lepideus HHB14362 ss-1]